MNVMESQARRLAATGCCPELRHVLVLLDEARAEIDRLEAAGLESQRRQMLAEQVAS